jgi:alpha-D-xyloside xylohydrolase
VLESWWQNWLAYAKQARVPLTAGRHTIRAEWSRDSGGSTFQLSWKTPEPDRPITLWSEVADGIDYTFVYGPKLDDVLAGYRALTGRASLMPIWSLGLWQSRQRYETARQSLDVLAEYRRRGIAIDSIVQDWFYWRKPDWGSHAFDPERFPDPQTWVDAIHNQYHARVMISVWGKFYPGNPNYDALQRRGFLYQPLLWEGVKDWVGFPYTDYDAFNPEARKLFWEQVRDALFTKKFDAWWMDATEPDISSPPSLEKQKARMNPTAAGTGARVLNAYALQNSRGVYEGQRSAAPDQRVFILTRSGFAGLQRYASATWSGDIPSTWESMRRQIAAGLGYSISGVPYWSMDIGGFTAPPRFLAKKLSGDALDEWCELNARWFQFGAFVPLVRLHGESQLREPWAFGGDQHPAFQAIVSANRLRYRLLPYLYSLAGAVTHDGTTFMRPLVMDFPADASARSVVDEYLFGPALLVAPVTEYKARQRPVYLPDAPGGWHEFWTGAHLTGGRTVDAAAPYDRIPLFVRAGSIVPLGPDLQYTTEKPADPVTLHVFTGADGAFGLYEDDGLTYGYERGAFARIPLSWNEATRTVTIGARQGGFPGMLAERTFEIVLHRPDRAAGYDSNAKPDRIVRYRGERIEERLP